MKISSVVLVATIFSATIGVVPAFGYDPAMPAQTDSGQKSSPMIAGDKQEYQGMLKQAYTMMGYVGVANIALLYNLTDEAAANTQKALTIARKLEGQTTQLNADMMKVGKLTYRSASGQTHDYWLPVVDDTFVVSDLDSEYLKSKQPKAVEEDAQTLTTKVLLDTKQMRNSLEKAAAALSAKNYSDAQVALIDAEQSTFTDQTANELPLVTAHENLGLAKALAKSKDYDGASFALNHAKDALKVYQNTADTQKGAQAAQLQTEITAMQAQIAKNRPSLVSDVETHIGAWIDKIKGL